MNEPVEANGKKRRAWLAALLSLLLPGLGQLYNGDIRLALALLLGVSVATPLCIWLIAVLPPAVGALAALIVVLASLVLLTFAILNAMVRARRLGVVAPAWFNRWYFYAGLYVLAVVWRSLVELLPIPSIESYSTPSSSMLPTLLVGDYLVARTRAFSERPPERGELVVFKSPTDQTTDYLKRIVGLPGDRIQLREGRLYINDVLVERQRVEDFISPGDPDAAPVPQYLETLPGGATYRVVETNGDLGPMDDTQVFETPADHCFVMGDNRDRSNDSRATLGFVPIASVRDKPLFIYWSRDLSRIGMVIE